MSKKKIFHSEQAVQYPARLGQGSRLRFLFKDSMVYGGVAALSKAFALITFPMLARHFDIVQYGIIDFFLSTSTLLTVLFVFGQDSAVSRFFYEYEDVELRRQLITQSLLFQILCLALVLPLFWFGADWITRLLIDAPDRSTLFKIVILQLPFSLFINFSQNLLKWTFSRTRFLTLSLGFTAFQAIALVVSVGFLDTGIRGILITNLCSNMLFGLIGLYFVRRWLVKPFYFRLLREMLPFAIPFGIICVVGSFTPVLERSLTDHILGPQRLGEYAVSSKIALLIGMAVNAFQTAWGPFSLSIYRQSDSGVTYNWVLKLFALGICMAVLLITLAADSLIRLLVSERYNGSIPAVFPLAMGLAFQATSWITEIGTGIAKRSVFNLYAYIVAIAATLAGISYLGPMLGLLGVALGVLIGHIAKAVVASWLAQRAFPLPWHYVPVTVIMLLTSTVGLVSLWLRETYGVLPFNCLLSISFIMAPFVGWTVLLNHNERRRILDQLK